VRHPIENPRDVGIGQYTIDRKGVDSGNANRVSGGRYRARTGMTGHRDLLVRLTGRAFKGRRSPLPYQRRRVEIREHTPHRR
jgi:hypothetical protein